MKLGLLCDAMGLPCPIGQQDQEVFEITTDSSRVHTNSMFVCIRGLHTDGHSFSAQAAERGARWIVCQEGCEIEERDGVEYFVVPNTRRATAQLFRVWYGCPDEGMTVIGVTGTNGKSSLAQMIAKILCDVGRNCGLIGTLGCYLGGQKLYTESHDPLANMTTPDPDVFYRILSEMKERGAEIVVMEVSSHALALDKVAPIEFDVGVFTNLTPEHLDFHETMEAYADAKSRLFTQSKISIINKKSPWAEKMIAAATGRVITCSVEDETSDYFAMNISLLGGEGISYSLLTNKEKISIKCSIPGYFTVENTMQAAVVARCMGISNKQICTSLAHMQGVKGRMERVVLPESADFTVLIDYAHTPDALQNLLETARQMNMRNGRIVLLFGCGGDRDRGKRAVMGEIASRYADHVVITSDNSRSENKQDILRQIFGGVDLNTPCTVILDRQIAIEYVISTAQANDMILLAGKGHEEYEIDANGRRFFSENKFVKEAFQKRQKNLGER